MFVSILLGLVRKPALTVAATATLALGIGAATALFSTVNAALLKPLPYPRAEDVYTVRTFFPSGRFTSGLVATEELAALRQMTGAVAAAAAVWRNDSIIDAGSVQRQVTGYGVSEGFFELAGAPMALGHPFDANEFRPGAPRSLVLSHRLWTGAFGRQPDIVGRTVIFDGHLRGLPPSQLPRSTCRRGRTSGGTCPRVRSISGIYTKATCDSTPG